MRVVAAFVVVAAGMAALGFFHQGADDFEGAAATFLGAFVLLCAAGVVWMVSVRFAENWRAIAGGTARVLRVLSWIAGAVVVLSGTLTLVVMVLEWMGVAVDPVSEGRMTVGIAMIITTPLWLTLALLAWLLRTLARAGLATEGEESP